MKRYAVYIPLLLLFACHKNNNNVGVNGALYADFAFKQGSYWIYQDSASNAIDSVYVDTTTVSWGQKGCVLMKGAPEYEMVVISMKLGGNSTDSESWSFVMTENKLSVSFRNNHDIVASRMGLIQLFTYPIQPGLTGSANGCVVTPDSGTIRDMGTYLNSAGSAYERVAASAHAAQRPSAGLSYNDLFYTSPTVGFVRLVFNHPADSVYRVLNLVRYKTVR